MNNGAFGENFPYSNFHDLNMDWIIKIAKDFLDQYTHIQETIDTGLTELDEKATNLEALLQEWYDTHSEDIANQLTSAMQDMTQALQTNEALFTEHSTQKAQEAIESIPADYTTLYNEVQSISESSKDGVMMQFCPQDEYSWTPGFWKVENEEIVLDNSQTKYRTIILHNIPKGYAFINNYSTHQSFVKNIITGEITSFYNMGWTVSNVNTIIYLPSPSDIYLTINTQNVSINNTVLSNIWIKTNLLNPYEWNSGYWNNDETYTEDSHYSRIKLSNCHSGIYEFNYYSPWQTYIKRHSTGVMTSLGSMGYTTASKYITIEIPYDFDLYLTQRSDALAYQENTLFYHEILQSDKLEYGIYNQSGNTFHVGATRKIKLLSEGITIAKSLHNSTLIVDPGNYNMYEELGGATYFDSYVADNHVPTDYYEPNWGIFLSNGIHIICEQGAEIYFIYTGNNTDVQSKFSLFNGGTGGFTLENANIHTQNIRYAIHDDMGSFALPYETTYKNCIIDHDSSETTWGAHQAIGGGFGRHGMVRIESCVLTSTYWIPVSYHNASGDINAEKTSGVYSRLYMNDSWLSGAITTNAYGRSTDMTRVYISNCSVGAELPEPQITGNYGVMNVVSTRWNNHVRQN